MRDRHADEIQEFDEITHDRWMTLKVIIWFFWFAALSQQLFLGLMPLSNCFVLACFGVGLWQWYRMHKPDRKPEMERWTLKK